MFLICDIFFWAKCYRESDTLALLRAAFSESKGGQKNLSEKKKYCEKHEKTSQKNGKNN